MSHTEGRVYPVGAFGYDTLIPPPLPPQKKRAEEFIIIIIILSRSHI